MCHAHTTDVCLEYFEKMRRQVYQTPKSYLSFIAAYQVMCGDSASDADRFFKLNFGTRASTRRHVFMKPSMWLCGSFATVSTQVQDEIGRN